MKRVKITLPSVVFSLLITLTVAHSQSSLSLIAPVDVARYFNPSGYMGDGEKGTVNVQMQTVSGENSRPNDTDKLVTRISYKPGSIGWAGVYWLSPANNWGDQPGRTLKGATKLVFWAAGAKGGEIVEFKSGGISGKKNHDTFEAPLGKTVLTKDWKRYEIGLKGMDLTSVIGAFAWVATSADNRTGVTFYVDAIQFE